MSESSEPGGALGRKVVYIHGIGRQRPAPELKVAYDTALFGRDVGELTRLAYWSDLRYTADDGADAAAASAFEFEGIPYDSALRNSDAQEYMHRLMERLGVPSESQDPDAPEAKILPFEPVRRAATWMVTRLFVRDTAAYFYDASLREAMRARLRDVLLSGTPPEILVAHSQGSIIAFDVLHDQAIKKARVKIPLWITIGSPLGIKEVQDKLDGPLRRPAVVGRWLNFADPRDPVALDRTVADDFRSRSKKSDSASRIKDERVENPSRSWKSLFGAHSATGYLSTEQVRGAVDRALGTTASGAVTNFVIARDVAAEMATPGHRINVMFELSDDVPGDDLKAKRKEVVNAILAVFGETQPRRPRGVRTKELLESGKHPIPFLVSFASIDKIIEAASEQRIEKIRSEAEIEPLRRFVAATLTSYQIDMLAKLRPDLKFTRVWRNDVKSALLTESAHTIHAVPAQQSYGAMGDGIRWAMLDSGINPKHSHFSDREGESNIAGWYDCTSLGAPGENAGKDVYGHGTHIAGIICGESRNASHPLQGIAPKSTIDSYKVLGDDGRGRDAWIIKALDHIAERNDNAPKLVIHGVNLSLGGSFDPSVYGCGFSPLCRELRRLWQQGVVVCVAAGNEGRKIIDAIDRRHVLNPSLSIGDPANLEECIAVGSVHKSRPVTHGVSYFSSRGPTADGRAKPDVVAPGERIVSANHRYVFGTRKPEPPYVDMSGTSMACAHVSGLIAAFLSVRREYIGRPDEVKRLLMGACTDLKRDRYHQGAGLPNLMKMLVNA